MMLILPKTMDNIFNLVCGASCIGQTSESKISLPHGLSNPLEMTFQVQCSIILLKFITILIQIHYKLPYKIPYNFLESIQIRVMTTANVIVLSMFLSPLCAKQRLVRAYMCKWPPECFSWTSEDDQYTIKYGKQPISGEDADRSTSLRSFVKAWLTYAARILSSL